MENKMGTLFTDNFWTSVSGLGKDHPICATMIAITAIICVSYVAIHGTDAGQLRNREIVTT